MASNNWIDDLARLLSATGGQQVALTFLNTWKDTKDLDRSYNAALDEAKRNGTIFEFGEIFVKAVLSTLKVLIPFLKDWFDNQARK